MSYRRRELNRRYFSKPKSQAHELARIACSSGARSVYSEALTQQVSRIGHQHPHRASQEIQDAALGEEDTQPVQQLRAATGVNVSMRKQQSLQQDDRGALFDQSILCPTYSLHLHECEELRLHAPLLIKKQRRQSNQRESSYENCLNLWHSHITLSKRTAGDLGSDYHGVHIRTNLGVNEELKTSARNVASELSQLRLVKRLGVNPNSCVCLAINVAEGRSCVLKAIHRKRVVLSANHRVGRQEHGPSLLE